MRSPRVFEGPEPETVHPLRAVAVELGLHSARFASGNGMHPTDVRALIVLMDARRAAEEMTAGRLGAALGLNSAGTTALVDRLERAGHVRRVRGAADRRKVVVEVDERAAALGQAFFGRSSARWWSCSRATTSGNGRRSGGSWRGCGGRRPGPNDPSHREPHHRTTR